MNKRTQVKELAIVIKSATFGNDCKHSSANVIVLTNGEPVKVREASASTAMRMVNMLIRKHHVLRQSKMIFDSIDLRKTETEIFKFRLNNFIGDV